MKKKIKRIIKLWVRKAPSIVSFQTALSILRKPKINSSIDHPIEPTNNNFKKLLTKNFRMFFHTLKLNTQSIKSHEQNLVEIKRILDSLWERIEFTRCELMFELANSRIKISKDVIETPQEIISKEKFEFAKKEKLKLNLGCGHIPLDDYINVDRRKLPGVDIVAEVNLLPIEPGRVDEIFSAHLLEHFPQEQLKRELLPYWIKLLKPNGIFHAVVPDAEAMIKEYAKGNYPYELLREVTFGKQDYNGNFHYNMFMPDQLKDLLNEFALCNFEVISRGRRNGNCFEMEIKAHKRSVPDQIETGP